MFLTRATRAAKTDTSYREQRTSTKYNEYTLTNNAINAPSHTMNPPQQTINSLKDAVSETFLSSLREFQ